MRLLRLVASAVVALLAAAAASALVLAMVYRTPAAFAVAFVLALLHAVLLGLPLFLLLLAKGWVSATTSAGGGFVVGIIPIGFALWPGHQGADVRAMYIALLLIVGASGAVGGLAFFALWKFFGAAFARRDAQHGA
jgi:hypothetical protein